MPSETTVELLAKILTRVLNFSITLLSSICPKFLTKCISWCPTSEQALTSAETKILLNLRRPYESRFVSLGKCFGKEDSYIRTISLNITSDKTPLVLLHSFGCGIGYWIKNLDKLAENRPVYAIDILGFGRSSRPQFSNDAVEAETQFFISIEKWRQAVGLKKFILLGHEMGGFIAASYALHYSERVSLLILEDPWGISDKPISFLHHYELDLWVKIVDCVRQGFNFLAAFRALGPFGPRAVKLLRDDFRRKYDKFLMEPNSILDYLYHCNAQTPSGEAAFKFMADDYGWPRHPMMHRLTCLDSRIPIVFVYGSRSWINKEPGRQIKYSRLNSYVDVQVVELAGHHVHADKSEDFNILINKICNDLDNGVMRVKSDA